MEVTVSALEPVGAEVQGIDARDPDPRAFETLHAAWLDAGVVRLRGQTLTKDDLLAFSRRFGTLDRAPINTTGKPWIEGYPELAVMSNVEEKGRPIGSLGYGEAVWHTDMSYHERPPKAALLYAIEVTRDGGQTGFLSMHEAYGRLPEALRNVVTNRRIKHDASHNSAGQLRKGFDVVSDPREAPGAWHPIVVKHPDTAREALYLGRRPNSYIEGLPLDESESLLDELWAVATDERAAWFHTWSVGDLLIWDNRAVMHSRRAFDPVERRYLLRTQVRGEGWGPAA